MAVVNYGSDCIYQMVPVTPADATVIPPTRGIWCLSSGNAVLLFTNGGSTEITLALVAGTFYPFSITVFKTATTGTYLACY